MTGREAEDQDDAAATIGATGLWSVASLETSCTSTPKLPSWALMFPVLGPMSAL